MAWLQLKIQTTNQYVEQINTFLVLFDAVAVTYSDAADQPILEPDLGSTPLWEQIWISCLFAEDAEGNKIVNFIKAQTDPEAILQYSLEVVADQNWERAWLDDFKPMQFGDNLWVCPSVYDPPDPNAINIILDPGLAFGTGTHPTTALCLEWLAKNPPKNQLVVDYGCGSGILAIAALKLGAKEVWAVDHDEQALDATNDNAQRNQIDLTQLKTCLPEQTPALQADLLIANIIANPLMELAPHFADLIKPKGQIVLSGILATQVAEVNTVYAEWFTMGPAVQQEDWVRLEGVRK